MKSLCLLLLAALIAALIPLAPRRALAQCRPVIIEHYYMGKCHITKTKRWDERRHHWDVKSQRVCK